MTDDKLYASLSVNTIMAKLTDDVQQTRFITSSTDKYYSLDSGDDFRSGCRNVSYQQQFFSELPSPDDHTTRTNSVEVTRIDRQCSERAINSVGNRRYLHRIEKLGGNRNE